MSSLSWVTSVPLLAVFLTTTDAVLRERSQHTERISALCSAVWTRNRSNLVTHSLFGVKLEHPLPKDSRQVVSNHLGCWTARVWAYLDTKRKRRLLKEESFLCYNVLPWFRLFGQRNHVCLKEGLITIHPYAPPQKMHARLIPEKTPRSIFVYFRGLFYDVGNDPEGGYYARESKLAEKVFYIMPYRDVVTWNSIIGGCVKNAWYGKAFKFFRQMLISNIQPDGFTFASILNACAKLGALSNTQWVHALMTQKKIELNSILISALIDAYSKCGSIQIAKEIFTSVPHNDISVWNAMIKGLAIHGLAMDALLVFSMMERENVLPDAVTFLGILTACNHGGVIEEGRRYFDWMKSRYSIQPQLEHYGVMVDLYSRAGFLEEAYSIIMSMPIEPDVVTWRTLLSGCRIYRNQELAEVAIANMSHRKSGDYVLLSNIYCSLNRWEHAETVREMMKNKGVRKICGKSWIELAGTIQNFKSGDRSHPEIDAVYKVLGSLMKKTRAEGYMPVTELVFMDISEEEKEENLSFHSEKLALAYAILKTSPGVKINISKNLRICDDCHRWIKLVSKLLCRVIVVRDRIRFHQFEGGMCSCGDCW